VALDIVLLIVMAALIGLAAAEGFVRSLAMLLLFYLLTLLLGVLAVAFDVASLLNDLIVTSLASGPTTPLFYQGLLFVGLLIPGFIIAVMLSHSALDDTAIKPLKWFDNVLGTLVGVVLALVFAAVLCNAWGVIVSERWNPAETWLSMRTVFQGSALRPFMMRILRLYRVALFPFSASGYPVYFIPQG